MSASQVTEQGESNTGGAGDGCCNLGR
jgi:hypothetical protein